VWNSKLLRNALWISAALGLAACGGQKAVLPEEGRTMLEIYQTHMGSAGQEGSARSRCVGRDRRRPDLESYTRTAENELKALFVRLESRSHPVCLPASRDDDEGRFPATAPYS
jgi:hypothetical protein